MELGAQSSGMIGREDGWMNGGKNRDEEGDEEGDEGGGGYIAFDLGPPWLARCAG